MSEPRWSAFLFDMRDHAYDGDLATPEEWTLAIERHATRAAVGHDKAIAALSHVLSVSAGSDLGTALASTERGLLADNLTLVALGAELVEENRA